MLTQMSCNGVTLITNYEKLKLENKKGAIVKIIAYLVSKSEEKDILNFKPIGIIREINSDTEYKISDHIILTDNTSATIKNFTNEQENFSKCFYFENEKVYPEGFFEEIVVTDEELTTYYNKITSEEIINLQSSFRTYALREVKNAIDEICLNIREKALISSNMLTATMDLSIDTVQRISVSIPPKTNVPKNLMPTVEHYKVNDPTNKHKCLEINEEFEKLCSETYEIKNSKFCLPMKDKDLIQSLIFNNKTYWDMPLFEKIDKILKDNAVILDIGSNIGNHSLYWCNERNAKLVYAFEPYPYTYKILEKNVIANNLENRLKIFPFGISDEITKGSVEGFCSTNIGGTGFEKNPDGDFDFKTLDSLSIPEKIDLIKIDVEGKEMDVIKGGMETIKKNLPIIVIETFSNKDWIEAQLFPLGYELFDQNYAMRDYIYCCKDNI